MKKEHKSLNLYPIDYPFETLIQRSNAVPQKLILNPDFQRKYKWDKDGNERASKFIESCLMRIPLPACYFAEDEDGNHIVIDGVQRITTIKRFFNNEFKLESLTVFKELEGKMFSELKELRAELESTTIRCIVLRKENPKELIQEIFSRLNQGAVQLAPQEIRHAIFPGSLDNLIIELGNNPIIKTFGGAKEKNSREQDEMVLRFFALDSDLSDYEGKLSAYLDKYMANNQNLSSKKINELKSSFLSTLTKCTEIFGEKPFNNPSSDKPRDGLVYYDLLMWSFKKRDLEILKKNKASIKKLFYELCNDSEFIKTLSGGLQKKTSIVKRRQLWEKKLISTLSKNTKNLTKTKN